VFYGPIEPWIGKQYPENSYLLARQTGIRVFVRPNKHDPGRAHVIVHNWDRLPTVELDLSPARLASGERFELRDAQNIFAPPVASGRFGDGRVRVSLRSLEPAAPIGNVAVPAHTAPEFAVFVLTGTPARSSESPLSALGHGWQRARRFLGIGS
jgi:hypothetical protein